MADREAILESKYPSRFLKIASGLQELAPDDTPNAAVFRVGTVAGLKAIASSHRYDNMVVSVMGYTSAGDGAGGQFYFSASSSATDNGGTVIQPAAGSGRWIRLGSAALSPEIFGAAGDGTTDDLAALNAYISYASTGQDIVLTPGKSYRVSAAWNVSKKVRIVGHGAKVKVTTDAMDPSTFPALIRLTAAGIVVEGLEVDGARSSDTPNLANGTLIRVEASDCQIVRCSLHDAAGCAIDATGDIARGLIQSCTIYNCFTGIFLNASGGSQCTFWRIASNTIYSGLATTTALSGGIKCVGTGSVSSVAGHVITANVLESVGEVGIELQTWCNDSVVNDNRIYCHGICLSFAQSARCSATGNQAQIAGAGSYGIAYESAGDGSHQNRSCSFTGNQALGYDRGGTIRGTIGYSCSEDQVYTTISGGVVDGFSDSGVHIQGSTGADTVSVSGVTFVRCFVPVTVAFSSGWRVHGNTMDAGSSVSYCFLTLDTTDGLISGWAFTNNTLMGATQNCAIQPYTPSTNQIKDGVIAGNISTAFTGGSTDFFNFSGAGGTSYTKRVSNIDNLWSSASGTYDKVAAVRTGVTRTTDLSTPYAYVWYNRAIIYGDTTGSNLTFALPPIADVEEGYELTFEKSSGGANKITVTADSQMIGKDTTSTAVFATSLDITTEHGLLHLKKTSGYWNIIRAR